MGVWGCGGEASVRVGWRGESEGVGVRVSVWMEG